MAWWKGWLKSVAERTGGLKGTFSFEGIMEMWWGNIEDYVKMVTWDSTGKGDRKKKTSLKWTKVSCTRVKLKKSKCKFRLVLRDKMRLCMSLRTLGSSGRCDVLMGTVFDMLRFSAIRRAVSGSDWKLESTRINDHFWVFHPLRLTTVYFGNGFLFIYLFYWQPLD